MLKKKNVTFDRFKSMREYTDSANDQFKSTFEYEALNGERDLFTTGFWLGQMLMSCEFQGQACNKSHFYWFHDYNYGNCYRFNGGETRQQTLNFNNRTVHEFQPYKPFKASRLGWRNGLGLEFYTGNQNFYQKIIYKTGLRVIISNSSMMPFTDFDGIDVAVGEQTNIGIGRSFTHRLSRPYSECVDTLDEVRANENDMLQIVYDQIKTNKLIKYQQDYCLSVCLQTFVIAKCNCSDLSLLFLDVPKFFQVKGCYSTEEIERLNRVESEFLNGNEIEICYEKCPNECNAAEFKLKTTSARNYIFRFFFNLFFLNKI